MDANDVELLREYAADHSEQAFRTLVERHIDMVYAIALRQTQNAALAEDVTQAVFVVLANKAAAIPRGVVLAGWLFRATRFAAANARRAEVRREHWERKAAEMESHSQHGFESDQVEHVTPALNEALDELPELDRSAILLRFFQSKTMEEVGRALGTSEDAAKMRLSRAVEKLRHVFRRRGLAVSVSALLFALSQQAAQAAPIGLATSVTTSALLNQSSTSTVLIAKGTIKLMAQLKTKKLAVTALALLFGGTGAVLVQQSLQNDGAVFAEAKAAEPVAPTNKVLVFRNVPSWNRSPDFEDVLSDLGFDFEVKPSSLMSTADLSRYRFVVIPGAQWRTDFYQTYAANVARFNQYLTNGGVLVLELNGAENDGIPLPRGVSLVKHGARDNTIIWPEHPILAPLGGAAIHANYASHCYLSSVPRDALVLATETTDGESDTNKPTFVEYSVGKGRVIAAAQCFHDRDNSGRGALMPTLLQYAAERKWYVPKK